MRVLLLLTALFSLVLTGAANAEIGWAGNAYPNSGHDIVPTGDQFVVAQVYKGGVTDAAGQGADISADLIYNVDGVGDVAVAMSYNTDIGSNDEYIGFIPQSAIIGGSFVDVTVVFTDLTDGTTFEITGDQNGTPPPLRYNIVDVLPNPVDVTFTLCMSGEPFTGAPCVIGSADAIGNWGTGVTMTQVDGDLWDVTVTFPEGINPSFEYKYRKNDCTEWESVPNRLVSLPTDGTTAVVLDADSWNNLPMGCGLGNELDHMVEVCFQVCMDTIENTGDVCVIGNLPAIGNWTDGLTMYQVGSQLYQACIYFQVGDPVPVTIEYKFRKDGCETWEDLGGADRVAVVDNSSPDEVTLTHNWDDNPDGVCEPVATEAHSWSTVKGMFQ